MTSNSSPHALFERQLHDLLAYLPALRDATPDIVHAARVATRRLRETLGYFEASDQGQAARMRKAIREAGRALGQVRDLDIMEELLERQGHDVPDAVHAISLARRELAERQLVARRRMIKAFECIELERLRDMMPRDVRRPWLHWVGRPHAASWAVFLRNRIGRRAARLRDAVHHATGVYFPNRTHTVRIAAKKLRYSVEIAQATGLWKPRHIVGDIREVQDLLGYLHDAQVLFDELDRVAAGDETVAGEVGLVQGTLKRQMANRHVEYLARRERLSAICAACDQFAGISPGAMRWSLVTRPLVAASAVAVPAGLLIGAARRDRKGDGASRTGLRDARARLTNSTGTRRTT
jgi:CHAD domain-containing protein